MDYRNIANRPIAGYVARHLRRDLGWVVTLRFNYCSTQLFFDTMASDEHLDRRESGRIPFRLPARVTIHPPPGQETETARTCHLLTQDLSGSGIGLVYAKPLCIGQRIDLELPDRCRSAVVCRIESLSDGHYLIGCQFDDDPTN